MKKLFINTGLLTFSFAIALILAEFMCRIFLDPADYLSVNLVDEPVLNHKIAPDSPGYDAWGFRNDSVPTDVDIVAIGDSQTYGINATKNESWPKLLGSKLNQEVYNMGLGSYGVVQYYHLFKTKALKLNPDRVIIGFYMGNDQMDSYYMSYYNENWHHLRDPSLTDLDRSGSDIIDYYLQQDPEADKKRALGGLRTYLSHNSLLYRLVVHGPLLGSLKRKLELKFKEEQNDEFTRLSLPDLNIDEGFRPVHRANKMDMNNIRIQEGLRISLQLIKEMKEICDRENIDFSVLIIPSKETVFGPYLAMTMGLNNQADVQRLLSHEQMMIEKSKSFFDSLGISYIDPASALRGEIGKKKIYPENYDDHPNAYGYSIIAEAIKQKLGTQRPITEIQD